MEDKFYRRLIDRDDLIIDRDKHNPRILRLSWLDNNLHYQGQQLFLDILDCKYDHPELRNQFDWYHAGYDENLNIYFSYTNKYLSLDLTMSDGWHTISRTYDLKELYKEAYC